MQLRARAVAQKAVAPVRNALMANAPIVARRVAQSNRLSIPHGGGGRNDLLSPAVPANQVTLS
jgi:hypothetical protein